MFVENFFSFLAGLSEHMAVPKSLTLVYENGLWGTSVSQLEKKFAKKEGYQVTGDVTYDAKDTDFEEALAHVRQASPSIILQASYAQDAVLFIKGYKEKQIDPVAILGMNAGFISPSFIHDLGSDAEYVLSREVWARDLGEKKPLVTAIDDLFKERYGRNMTGNSARTFTAFIVLADAMNRAGSLEPAEIRNALLDTNIEGDRLIMPWDGVRFDPATGQNLLGKGIIVQVQEGHYQTVWPQSLAAKPVAWPMPSWLKRSS